MNSKSKFKGKQSKSKPKNQSKTKTEPQNNEDTNRKILIDKKALSNMTQEQQLSFLKQNYMKITIQPQQNIKYVQNMFIMAKINNVKVVCSSLLTLAQTFTSIAPLQPINLKQVDERLSVKITKQQFKVLKFEKVLLEEYEKYIKMLNQFNMKIRKENFENNIEIFKEFKKCILTCVVKCFQNLWHFNFSKQVCELLVKFVKYEDCLNAIQKFLRDKNVSTLQSKSKIVAAIANIITRKHERQLPNNLVKIINVTYVDHRYLKKDKQTLQYKKKQLKKKLYRQEAFDKKKQKQKQQQSGTLEMKRKKKHQKALQKLKVKQQVQKQFAEADAVLSNRQLMKYTSAILQQLFYVYFKILVDRENSKFLRDCLDGILSFAQMINIDLISSLIDHLAAASEHYRLLWKQNQTSQLLEIRILLIFTAQSVINGPLSVYNMDDLNETKNLFKILKDINGDKKIKISRQLFRLMVLTLQEAFVKKRQLSHETTASFVKEIAIFCTRPSVPKLVLMDLIRLLAGKYNKIVRMLQQDNQGFGFNSYNPTCQDPQCSNAINTSIIKQLNEIDSTANKVQHIVNQTQKNQVNSLIQHLKKQNFISASKQRKTFQEIFQQDLNYFQ